jgi:predicted Na+-dependent transporter
LGVADEDTRAITLVTGMQSSTMATVLCVQFFPHLPSAIVTTILSTIVMSNSGMLVAAVWRSLPSKQIE